MAVHDQSERAGALAVTDVTKAFGGLPVLEGVSLAVQSGESVGLIGPNGCGKTTLVNIMSGVIPPTSGKVTLGASDLTRAAAHKVAHAGLARTFQGIRLFADMTVSENVEVGAACSPRVRGWRARTRQVVAALKQLRLDGLEGRLATELPYGVQRRVEIARALAGAPRFLLLDEPAAGLNEDESDDLLKMLGEIAGSHACGILVIDHDLRLIMRFSQRILVLNDGTLIAQGAPDDIRRDHAVIEAYLGADANANAPRRLKGGAV